MLRLRMAAKRKCSWTNKNSFFASCSSSSNVHVAVELDSIFASDKHRESGFEKVDLIIHGNMSFFLPKSMWKLDSSSKFYANVILLMILIVDHPVNSNLEETLGTYISLSYCLSFLIFFFICLSNPHFTIPSFHSFFSFWLPFFSISLPYFFLFLSHFSLVLFLINTLLATLDYDTEPPCARNT